MTIVSHCEVFETKGGQLMFIERYVDTPCTSFWRYGFFYSSGGKQYSEVYKDMLLSKPNKKRLAERY